MLAVAVILCACHKDESLNNGTTNTENPGGTDNNTNSHIYPNTAEVYPNAVTDIDGNQYDAVKIGEQVWMAENLRTSRYADGSAIPMGGTTSSSQLSDSIPYKYYPGGSVNNVPSYGYLYNWPAAMHGENSSESNPSGVQGICPDGWHLPSMAEFNQLLDYIESNPVYLLPGNNGNPYLAASTIKALAATWGWNTASTDCGDAIVINVGEGAIGYDMHLNNATGFSAVGAGDQWGDGLKEYTVFWSATEWIVIEPTGRINLGARSIQMANEDCLYVHKSWLVQKSAYSVRCVRNY